MANSTGLFGGGSTATTGTSTNPTSTTTDDGLVVQGVGALLGLPVGQMNVGQATQQLSKLAKESQTSSSARAQLAEVQNELYTAGYYGTYKPKIGTLSGGNQDLNAFRKALIDASRSGAPVGTFLSQAATQGAQAGNVGSAAIPQITEKQTTYAPSDIQGTVNSTAQTLLGRNATQGELQAIADQLNTQSAQATNADITNSEASAAGSEENKAANNGAGDVDSFLAAIRQHESGGNYTANNAEGGASGAYQYIQSTWSSEAKAAGYGQYASGPAGSAPPAVQDAVARYNALNLYSQYGSWQTAAEAWYYPAWAQDPSKQNSVPYPSAGNTETIGQYGQQIVSAMNDNAQPGAQGVPAVVGIAQSQVGTPSTDPQSHPNGQPLTGAALPGAISKAEGQIGTPYQWGGESPGSGFDCSGLVQWAYQQAGVSLPRVAQDQYNSTTKVSLQQATPGDLVFFGTGKNGVDHVGIYIGNDQMVVAPHTGTKVQIQNGVMEMKNLVGFTQVTPNGMTPADWAALSKAKGQGGGAFLTAQANGTAQPAATDNVTVTPTPAGANSVDDAATSYFENNESSQFQSNNLLKVFQTIKSTMAGTPAGDASVRNTPVSLAPETS